MIWPRFKTYLMFLGFFVLIEVVSWIAYLGPTWEQWVTGLVSVLIVGIAWKRPRWLALISIAEIVVGSKGYLLYGMFHGQHITLRMIVFVILVAVSIRPLWRAWIEARTAILSRSWLFLMAWLGVAVVVAFARSTGLGAIYSDANAFVFFLLLPAWWVQLKDWPEWKSTVVALLMAGATVIGVKTWLMVILFGQNIHNLRHVYEWIRNTGVGEITYINANMYRVFFQSQVYSLLVFCFVMVGYVRSPAPRWILVPLAWSAIGIYISLSRSFWLGLAVALITLVAWFMRQREWSALRRCWILLPLGVTAWAMFVWGLSFPAFRLSGGRASAVVARLQGSSAADASTSRTNQIRPLVQSIGHHPVIGSGFGTTVTYISTDPRTPGWKTTAAFELGYLDLWLKIGLVGLILYGVWILGLWRRVSRQVWGGPLIIAGIALVVVHSTSPYLNHPLGIGWLMMTSLFAYDRH